MTLEEEMALAVLRGEKGTALILAQKLCEEHVIGSVELEPIKTMTIPAGKKRLILTLDPAAIAEGNVEIDYQEICTEATRWINGEIDHLVLVGFNFHLFVEPEPLQTRTERGAALLENLPEAKRQELMDAARKALL